MKRGPTRGEAALGQPYASRRIVGVVVAVLLAAFFLQSVLSMRLLCATSDETVHLPAGYSYLRNGEIRLNPEHPPLLKMIAAAPLLMLKPICDFSDPSWTAEPPDQLGFGSKLLNSNDADRLLFWGRMPIVLLALVLGYYLFRWSRDLFGTTSGLLALFLFAFSPEMIAHSHLVTMDLGLSCFLLMTLYHAWRLFRCGSRLHLLATGISLGLALAAKFSGVILVPTLAVLFGLAALLPDGSAFRSNATGARLGRRVARGALAYGVVLGIATLVVWAVYLFPKDPLFYWNGLSLVNANHNPEYKEFLLGSFARDGWWYYFLLAFLFKTPVPSLILLVLSLVLLRRYRAANWLDEATLIVPAVLFTAVTSVKADDCGVRYILPVYPLVFVFVSRLAPLLLGGVLHRAVGASLAAWYLAAAVWIFPDHLAYFNELTGGPGRGHKYLDDSNVDWGQDLKRLKTWMDERHVPEIKLLYPWSASPRYYGIKYSKVTRKEWEEKPAPGIYAMSTHALIRAELIARERGARGNWLTLYRPIDRVGYSIYIFRFD